MSNPSGSNSSDKSSDQLSTRESAGPSDLQTSKGNTTIADGVVQKIAGVSARMAGLERVSSTSVPLTRLVRASHE